MKKTEKYVEESLKVDVPKAPEYWEIITKKIGEVKFDE